MARSPDNGRTGALLGMSGSGIPVVLALLILFLASVQTQAQEESQVLLSSEGTVVLGPDDTLELVLRTRDDRAAGTAVPELRAWLLASEQQDAGEGEKPQGRVLTVSSTTRPGEWLAHIRGLKPPKADRVKAWDLLLRWNSGAEKKTQGTVRLKGAVAFREGQPDVVLLLDGSLSMGRTDPNRLRVEASRTFVALGRASGGIGRIALVQFDDKTRTILPLTPIGQAAAIEQGLEKIGESGETDIDGGIRRALEILKGDREQAAGAIVLLTDGKQEPGEYKDAHALARAANVPVHTVALGHDADRALLRRIAADTGGTFADAVRDQDLLKMYAAVAGKIAGGRTILSAEMPARGGTAEFQADGACRTLALSAASRGNGALTLTGPGGALLRSGVQPHPLLFQMAPAAGSWKAEWTPEGGNSAATVNASAQTPLYPLFFRTRTDAKGEIEIDPDEPRVALSLTDGAENIATAEITVALAASEGQPPLTVRLFDDGKHDDGAAGDGVFAGEVDALRDARMPGDTGGTLTAVVQGTRMGGEAFRREVRATWSLKRSGARALLTSGAADLGAHWSGTVAEGRISLRIRGQGGAISVESTLAPQDASALPGLTEYLEIVSAPEKLSAGGRGEVAFRVRIPEGTPEGLYAGTFKLTLSAASADPAIAVTAPWRVRVHPAQLSIEPARLDLGDLPPGAVVQRAIKIATRGGVLNLAPFAKAEPAAFLKRRDPRFALLPSSIFSGSNPSMLEFKTGAAGFTRAGTEPVELALTFAIPPHATSGRLEETLVLRDRFGRSAARLPVTAHVSPQHLDVPGAVALGELEPGDEVARPIAFPLAGELAQGVAYKAAVVKIANDRAEQVEASWNAGETPNSGTLRLRLNAQMRQGTLGGWLSFEAGPALAYRRWQAHVVEPALKPEVSEIDLGTLLPGQSRTQSFLAAFKGARSTFFAARVAAPPCKPKLRHIALPQDALRSRASKSTLIPNGAAKIELELQVPDLAQDGNYEAKVALDSRLGSVEIPVRFRVAAPVPQPPFHVAPGELTLRVVNGTPDEPAMVVVTSHSDEELSLAARVEPAAGLTRACVDLLAAPDAKAGQALTVALPGRAETRLLLRAWPDARSDERCRLVLEGAGERQAVEIAFQVVNDPRLSTGGPRGGISFFDWLRILILLLIALLIFLARTFFKQRWVRFAAYTLAFHAAVLMIAVPSSTMMNALPDAMQVSILNTQEELGFELSPEQERRLAALATGAEGPAGSGGGAPKEGGALAAAGRDATLPAAQAHAAAPAAEGVLAKAQAQDARKASAAPGEPQRTERPDEPEKALAAEALDPTAPPAPEPAPAAQTVSNAPVEAPLALKDPTPGVLPAQEPPAAQAPATTTAATLTKAAPSPITRVMARPAPEPSATRAARDIAVAEDPPLASNLPEASDSPDGPLAQDTETPQTQGPRNGPVQGFAMATAYAPSKLDAFGKAGGVLIAKPQSVSNASWLVSSGLAATPTGTSYGGGSKGQGLTKQGGGQQRVSGLSAGNAEDGALEALAVPNASGKGGGTQSGGGTGTHAGGGGTHDAGGRDADGDGPAGPRGGPGGWGLVSWGTGKNGTGSGSDPLSTGTALTGKPGAKGTLPGLGDGLGLGGSERLGLGGRGGTGQGIGRGEGRGTGLGDGDAPLAADGWGKGGNGRGAGEGTGPAVGGTGTGTDAGQGTGPGDGAGRTHAAGSGGGLGLIGSGPGGGSGTLAGLGGTGGPSKLEGPGGAAASFAGFALDPQKFGVKTASRLSGQGKDANGNGFGDRPVWGSAAGQILRVTLGLAKHAADWNSSPTALHNLSTAFKERCGLPDVESTVKIVALTDRAALSACRVILITANDPIAFTPAERDGLRAYITGGGLVWVNDSGPSGDERFDAAFRRELPAIVPGAKLERIDASHPLFRSAYDLSRGFKGYRIPPGDKYRQEFIEVLAPDKPGARVGLIYTRNDYADGLEIDPRNIAGRPSLTDLSADEMLEGSLRFGVNVIAYALGAEAPRMPPPPESAAQASKFYRYSGPELPAFDDFSKENDANAQPLWVAEDWGNPAVLAYANIEKGRALKVAFTKGAKSKAAVTRDLGLDLSKSKSIVLDLYSSLPHGFNVALLFQTRPGWVGYECRPVYVKPGWNRNLRFPLDLDDFKSAKNDWKTYDQPFGQRSDVAKISVLLYNLESDGEAMIGNLRIEK
ncbi:MAG: DUF4159 domain-containing protein [Planctomycetes bacterium]|nr:DUF4159 domain-containing protein [Planctomycetota bacterium]